MTPLPSTVQAPDRAQCAGQAANQAFHGEGRSVDLFDGNLRLCRCRCGKPARDGSVYAEDGCRGRYSRMMKSLNAELRNRKKFADFLEDRPEVYVQFKEKAEACRFMEKRPGSKAIAENLRYWGTPPVCINNTLVRFMAEMLEREKGFEGFFRKQRRGDR